MHPLCSICGSDYNLVLIEDATYECQDCIHEMLSASLDLGTIGAFVTEECFIYFCDWCGKDFLSKEERTLHEKGCRDDS